MFKLSKTKKDESWKASLGKKIIKYPKKKIIFPSSIEGTSHHYTFFFFFPTPFHDFIVCSTDPLPCVTGGKQDWCLLWTLHIIVKLIQKKPDCEVSTDSCIQELMALYCFHSKIILQLLAVYPPFLPWIDMFGLCSYITERETWHQCIIKYLSNFQF